MLILKLTIYLDDASIALQITFIVEMALRALAHGFKRYFRDGKIQEVTNYFNIKFL